MGPGHMELPPLPVPFDEQAWGTVTAWEVPMPGVYKLETEKGTGIYVVDRSQGISLLPEGVFSYGIPYEHGKYIYFDYDHGRYVVEYEVLISLAMHSRPEERQTLLENALSAAILGAEDYAAYFGPYTPQHTTPWGRMARRIQADSGVWFIQAGGVWALDVCSALRPALNDSVRALGRSAPGLDWDADGDLYWALEDCAPAVWELLERRPGLVAFLTSEDDLQYCLCELFPHYVRQYNEGQSSGGRITKKDGASIQFLKLPI